VQVPAFVWSRFDARPVGPPGDDDVLIGDLLHGRLDRASWATVRDVLFGVRPLAAAAVQRGRASGDHLGHVLAPLHRRYRALVPHLTRSTRRALFPSATTGPCTARCDGSRPPSSADP
jgi:hypothetical protein